MFQYKILCAVLVIAGTYILSKQLFEQSFKKQIDFKFGDLPLYLRCILVLFGDRSKFESGALWAPEPFPSSEHFSLKQKWQLVAPFLGFILIVLGTIGAVFV